MILGRTVPLLCALDAADDLDQRALAAAARPEDAGHAFGWEAVRYAIERDDLVRRLAEDLDQIVDDDLHYAALLLPEDAQEAPPVAATHVVRP